MQHVTKEKEVPLANGDPNGGKLKIIEHFDETKPVIPTEENDKTIHADGREETHLCVSCELLFSPLQDRIPYNLPCGHIACIKCL